MAGRRRATRARGRTPAHGHGHGHGYGHGHGDVDTSAVDADAVVARRVRLVVAGLLVPLVLAAVILTIALWPTGKVTSDALLTDQARGQIVSIKPCPGDPRNCDRATVRITDATAGPTGQQVPVDLPKGKLAPTFERGEHILLGIDTKAPPASRYQYVDHDRSRPLLLLAVVFAVAVVALSRWRGVAALGALVVTGLILTKFVLPAILKGSDPLLVAVVGGTLIMVLALYLTHGVNAQTSIALVGTISALALTAVLGTLFIEGAKITGLSAEGIGSIETYLGRIDLQGLIVAGLVIGALGVLDDVTVTQAAAVWELSAADPAATRSELVGAGLRIGRAHVASVVNTLMLAYAGSALPTLVIFAASAAPAAYTVSTEQVAIQVISGLVGSLGIIAAVPLTTALAALAVGDRSAHEVAVDGRQYAERR
jgi:uncharacterized membrane protein